MKRISVVPSLVTAGLLFLSFVGSATGVLAEEILDFGKWAKVSPASGWTILAGEFSGEGHADLVAYHPSNGSVWVGRNTGSSFVFRRWATLSPASDWRFVVGEFNGSGHDDIMGYHPSYYFGNGTIWVGENTGIPPEGYAWPLSAAPGETIRFYASGLGKARVEYFRHKSTGPNVSSIPMGGTSYSLTVQPIPAKPWRDGCGWAESFSLKVPREWPSGIYSARLSSVNEKHTYITFIVNPRPSKRSSVAVLANVNTWLAYNAWGGKGKYSGAAKASFLRPNPEAAPIGESIDNHHLTRAELWVLSWLEDQGYQPDVYTDIDFHNGLVVGYDKLVLSTHPEYWSSRMYRRLKLHLESGNSVLYLGGNGIYEKGIYSKGLKQMVFRGGVEDGPRDVSLFRKLSPPLPERELLGVATERCGVEGTAFEVLQESHPFFAGTGLVNGGTFGESGLNTGGRGRHFNGKASAWEVDTSNGPGALNVGIGCGSPASSVPASTLPAGLSVLARAKASPGGRGAEITFYNHPGGGFVFSAGSITFGGSLVVDPQIQKILRNVLATR